MRLDRRTARFAAIAATALLMTLTLASSSQATAPAAHAGRTYFAQNLNGDSPAYRPTSLSPEPGATLIIKHVTWASWTSTQAKGTGTVLANDCNPDCASGHYRHDPATIHLHSPHVACGKRFFDKMELHYTGKNFPTSINRHEPSIVQPDFCGIQPASARTVATTGSSPPFVLSCLGTMSAKPADDVADCDSAATSWRGVTWTTWTSDSASGRGEVVINNCKPSCAAGHFHTYQATVALSNVQPTTSFGALFGTASITYARGNRHKTITADLPTEPSLPTPTLKGGEFFSPITGIGCEVDFTKGSPHASHAYCQRVKPTASLTMTPKGKITRCVADGCIGDAGENTPTLHYGQVEATGPYRCLSSRAGVICAVRSGLGFLISKTSLARIKGY
jgi:hypothetical protein